ncbi:Qa-SNARE, SYP3/Sed5p/Syntaxin 5-type [Reticulomyxa filosa]|uniref:Qa-SNARE, SYP3/Sed5p/Syntaxin 5-type n=1 Tax=Reticulomyxa filosa TaxID=46433 RepID=X6NTW5_RETFI|nr:Qa-SNARE, SYP3/Sed5p/Syntaxin 5-type [Reticulomyxa filosa]|eukprot:ETO29740.1 Qa-SNARE, SYP3/Sed5p/Syntaxin 5-type [Reticulomyxa filosa]
MLDIKQDVERFDNDLKSIGLFIKHSYAIKDMNSDNCADYHYNLLNILQARYSDLAKTFAISCQVSTEALQKQKEERDKYGGGKGSFRSVPRNRAQSYAHIMHMYYTYYVYVHMRKKKLGWMRSEVGNEEENQNLLSEERDKQTIVIATTQQSQAIADVESGYHESRALEAQQVEQQLTEVARMMAQLADYVETQRNAIIRINVNTDEAVVHVEGAIEQLQKYLASLSGNRWLIIKIFAILIIFAFIFTVFIA